MLGVSLDKKSVSGWVVYMHCAAKLKDADIVDQAGKAGKARRNYLIQDSNCYILLDFGILTPVDTTQA